MNETQARESKDDTSDVAAAAVPIENNLEMEMMNDSQDSHLTNEPKICEANNDTRLDEKVKKNFAKQKKAFYHCAAAKMRYDDFFELVRKENKSGE